MKILRRKVMDIMGSYKALNNIILWLFEGLQTQ